MADDDITRVIFRKFLDHKDGDYGDGIIALFPDDTNNRRPGFCMMYEHVGQHGEGDLAWVISITQPATEAEYADLKAELEAAPYEYRFKVLKRSPH